jgi:hypothetical protein
MTEFEGLIEIWNLWWDLLGAPLIVALFFWFRFNSIEHTRSYTTAALYWFGVACFVLPFIGIYFVLAERANLSPLAAVWTLILFWAVPWVPPLWRQFWHSIAQIPDYAHHLSDALTTVRFDLRPADAAAVSRRLARIGYQTDDISAVHSTIIQARIVKIAAIMHHLEEWETVHRSFMVRNVEQYSALLQGYDLLSFKTIRVLKNVAAVHSAIMQENARLDGQSDDWGVLETIAKTEVGTSRLQSKAQSAAGGMLEDLRKDLDFFLDRVLLFVARGILTVEWSSAGRRRRLEAIGFNVPKSRPSIVPAVTTALGITIVWTMAWFLLMGDTLANGGHVTLIRGIILPTLNLAVNFVLVYHFRRTKGFANEGVFGGMPVAFILTIGLVTAILVLPIRILLDYYEHYDHVKPNQPFWWIVLHGLPLSLFPWITGAVTALLAQDSIWQTIESSRTKRLLDGVLFGLAMATATGAILLIDSVFPIPSVRKVVAGTHWAVIMSSAFIFGLVIGFLVIARIREGSTLAEATYQRSSATLPA